VSTLFTTGKYVCALPEDDDMSWWCPEQDDNYWNFEIDSGTRGTLGFSQVYQMKINGKTCGHNWASEELELKMQGNPITETVNFSFSYDDFKDMPLGSFTRERLDSGICAPIPALAYGTYGFGAGLYLCLAIENFDITDELLKGELHTQLTSKVNFGPVNFEMDLYSKLLMTFNIDESNEDVDLDALPTVAPVAYTLRDCPHICSTLVIGSAEACLPGILSCALCGLNVCKTYLAEVKVLEEGAAALQPSLPTSPSGPSSPSSPTGPSSPSGPSSSPTLISSSAGSAWTGLLGLIFASVVAFGFA